MRSTANRQWIAGVLSVAALWALAFWTPWAEPAERKRPESVLGEIPAPLRPSLQTPESPIIEQPAHDLPAEPHPSEPPEEPASSPPALAPTPPAYTPPQAQGPLRMLKQRFGSESADDSARAHEQKLTAAFTRSNPPPELLDEVVCHRSVCRISTSWKSERMLQLMLVLAELRRDFDPNLGMDEAGPPDAHGARRVEVYIDLESPRPPVP